MSQMKNYLLVISHPDYINIHPFKSSKKLEEMELTQLIIAVDAIKHGTISKDRDTVLSELKGTIIPPNDYIDFNETCFSIEEMKEIKTFK